MDKRRLVVLGMCLAVCVAMGSAITAWAVKTEKSILHGDFVYPPGHYLAGETIRPGHDIFGVDLHSQTNNTNHMNHVLCWDGLPPYEGDDEAYFQRLVDEGFALDLAEAQAMMEAKPLWWCRTWRCVAWWNDGLLSNDVDLNDDGYLDSHPYGYLGPGMLPFELGQRDSGGAFEGIWWNLRSTGPGDEGAGTMHLTLVAVPRDAVRIDGMWYDSSGNVIGFDHGPPTPKSEDCWAAVRRECRCRGELMSRYRSPSHWGKFKVRGD